MKLVIKPLREPSTTAQQPLPPPTPCPWLWRCHSCYTIYRLAVTRRCLDCDHTFCLGEVSAGPSPQKSKKRKRGGPCKAEFDYAGWKSRGAWRRTVLLNGENNHSVVGTGTGTGTATANSERTPSWGDEHKAADGDEAALFADKREHLFLRKRHNCFLHCDFPSECHHSLFRAQQEGRPILREALVLDAAEAAREEAAQGKKRFTKKLTVQEYKQRRNAQRRAGAGAGAGTGVASRFVEDLSTVDEEEADDEEDSISPCSPTSPDPPGDLMREVSPVEREGADDDDLPPVSPSGRRSLLVTTDTPVDFATTAAPLSFDDDETYSDDEDEYGDDDEDDAHQRRRTKSRRKIAQLTGEGLESFGPFVLDPLSPSPTSPSRANNHHHLPAALDLQAAYSEQAWFSNSSSSSSSTHPHPTTSEPLSPRSPERVGKRDRMLALLGRRGGGGAGGPTSSPTRDSAEAFNVPVRHQHQHQHQHQQQRQHADATAADGEEWESWSDSDSSSSSASTTSSGVSGPFAMDDDTDADGDVAMRDAAAPSPDKDGDDEDMESPVTPPGGPGAGVGGDGADEDLRVLLRMRNAFMRGDMM